MTALQKALRQAEFSFPFVAIADAVGDFFESLARARMAHQAQSNLNILSNAELASIGMTRDDIDETVRKILIA